MHAVFQRWMLILVGVLLVTASGLVDIYYETPVDLIVFAMILIGVNAVLRPIVVILTLPVTVLTLGVFALVVNALTFWLTAQLYWGVHVESFFHAAFAALLLSIFTFVAGSLIR
jgi:putative membrane protein